METNIKVGDLVRLTDPISKGEIVRIDNVNEYGFAEFVGGSQAADMEQIPINEVNPDLCYYYNTLSDLIRYIETKIGVKLYPESAVLHYKHEAEIEEKEHIYYEQAWNIEHNERLNLIDELEAIEYENDKIKQEHNKWKKEVIDCTEANELLTAQVYCRDEEIERLNKRIKELSKQLFCSDKNQ